MVIFTFRARNPKRSFVDRLIRGYTGMSVKIIEKKQRPPRGKTVSRPLDYAMTVRRHSEEYFDAAPAVVAGVVRAVFAHRPPYVQTRETDRDLIFKTNVKPSWWLLGTEMTIQLQPSSGGTQVSTMTKSQWFILGDVFNLYNGYIRDFLRDLRTELHGLA